MLFGVEVSFDITVLIGLVGASVGAITSLRLLGPNRKRVIAETVHLETDDADKIIAWYKDIVARQDAQIQEQEAEIQQCERKIEELRAQVAEQRGEISDQRSRYELLVRKLERRGFDLSNGDRID